MLHDLSRAVLLDGGPTTLSFFVGTVLFSGTTLAFAARALGSEPGRARRLALLTALVPAIPSLSYCSMLLGIGVTEVSIRGLGSVAVYWARYADWIVTTPLLLFILSLLAGVDRTTIFGAVAADVFMVATGLVAALSGFRVYRFVWWAIGVLAFLAVGYYLLGPLTATARRLGRAADTPFYQLRNLTVVLWTVYPLWWLAGSGGPGLLPVSVEMAGFVVLDGLAKVGFGVVFLWGPGIGPTGIVADEAAGVGAEPTE
jgi:bacteriorhodopsin